MVRRSARSPEERLGLKGRGQRQEAVTGSPSRGRVQRRGKDHRESKRPASLTSRWAQCKCWGSEEEAASGAYTAGKKL